jgi:hypothetical protein
MASYVPQYAEPQYHYAEPSYAPAPQMLSYTPPVAPAPAMPAEHLAALNRRFNCFAEGSGVRGVLYYPQFILMLCDLYHIASPKMIQKRWADCLWREVDVENSGSINFEAFSNWFPKYFDPVSVDSMMGSAAVQRKGYASGFDTTSTQGSKLPAVFTSRALAAEARGTFERTSGGAAAAA